MIRRFFNERSSCEDDIQRKLYELRLKDEMDAKNNKLNIDMSNRYRESIKINRVRSTK